MKIRIKDYSFYIPWVILITNTILAQSYLSRYSYSILTMLGIILMFTRICFVKVYRLKELIYFSLFFILALIIMFISKDKRLLWGVIVIGAMKNVDFSKIVKLTFYTMSIIISVISLSCICLYGNIGTSLKGGLSLGLGHPNILHGYFSLIAILFIYLKWDKLNTFHIIVMEIFNMILYGLTLSRSGMGILSIVFLMILIYKLFPYVFLLKVYKLLCMIGVCIFTILPILYFYDPHNFVLNSIDKFMTGRLWQGAWYYNISPIGLFGNYFEELYSTHPYALLDMGFFRIIIEYGLLAYFIFVLSYYRLLNYVEKARENLFFLLIFMIIFTYIESLGTYIFFNVSLLEFSAILYKKSRNTSQKNINAI